MPGIFRFKFAINDINNATLTAVKAMPQKDLTSDGTDNFAITRNEYVKTHTENPQTKKKWYGNSTNRDSSVFIREKQINEIGVGSLNAKKVPFSFTSSESKNVVNDALRRVRAGGAIAPLKKVYEKPLGQTPGFPTGNLVRPGCKIVRSVEKYNNKEYIVENDCNPVHSIHPKAAMINKPISKNIPTKFH